MYWLEAFLSLAESAMNAMSSMVGSLAWPVAAVILGLVFRKQVASALETLQELEIFGMKGKWSNKLERTEAQSDALRVEQPDPPAQPSSTPSAPSPAGTTQEPQVPPEPTPTVPEPPTPAPPMRPASPAPASSGSTPSTPRASTATPSGQFEPSPGAKEWSEWWSSSVTADPSGMVMRAWQAVYEELFSYANMAEILPKDGIGKNMRLGPSSVVRRLERHNLLDPSAAKVIRELLALRNDVAHGKHEPTSGEAITYELSAANARSYIRSRHASFQSPFPSNMPPTGPVSGSAS
jgi:hypothetical protein